MNVKYGDLKKQDRPRGCFCKHPSNFASQKPKISNYISLIVVSKILHRKRKRGKTGGNIDWILSMLVKRIQRFSELAQLWKKGV